MKIAEGFTIRDHVTCFTVVHDVTGTTLGPRPYGRTFSSREEAEQETTKWLPWFYSVSFKVPGQRDLRWINVPTQDPMDASKRAQEAIRADGLDWREYGISRIREPIRLRHDGVKPL